MANACSGPRGRYLTTAEVLRIKLYLFQGHKPKDVARYCKVCLSTVYLIRNRQLHRDVA